jgi:hypothetical protein
VCASTLVVFALAVSERVIEQIVVATRTPNNAAHALISLPLTLHASSLGIKRMHMPAYNTSMHL